MKLALAKHWFTPAATLIYILALGLVGLIVWSTHFSIDELARARGQVIAVERTQVVQATQDGVLAGLLVQEGQAVKQGALMVKLDATRAKAAYEDSRNKVAALKASLSRLRAEVYGHPLEFPADLYAYATFRDNQTRLYRARKQSLSEGIAAFEESRNLVRAEIQITEPLLQSGDVGKSEVIRLKRQESELDGQITNLRNKFFQDAQADMTRAEEELATQEQLLQERTVVLQQAEIKAPVDGVVRKISVTTIGAAIRNGEVLLEMLPASGDLIVEAKYSPADVAALQPGLPARVKLDAFDDSIYGALAATVNYISPDALMEPDGKGGERAYYRVRLSLAMPQNPAGLHKRQIAVNPGMTVTVEVRTRARTVFQFLTKPITKTFSDALGER